MSRISEVIEKDAELIEDALKEYLSDIAADVPDLAEAMRYSVLGGGKRIRPFLVLEFCRAFGGDTDKAVPLACALEMIHCYSLIHDDLPCMDDDDLRRGKPSTHIKFGEATALLAGDALLAYAFEVASSAPLSPESLRTAIACLSASAGPDGMVGGQVLDLYAERNEISENTLKRLYSMKTGALIKCACLLGCTAAGAGEDIISAATDYAEKIGLTFQIIDDILDVTSTESVLGKTVGSDEEHNKTTFLTFMSIDDARRIAKDTTASAKESIRKYDKESILCEFADYLLNRYK